MSDRPRIVVDLLGAGERAAAALHDVAAIAAARPELEVVLVADPATPLPTQGGLRLVPAYDAIAPDEDPARAVRARRGASVRVATRLLRDGEADAVVSLGGAPAALAAAQFSLGRLPGMTKICLATELRRDRRDDAGVPAVLVDSGAGPDTAPETLVQHAYAGVCYARATLGVPRPVVGLLSAGFRPGSGDLVHDETDRRLAGLPFAYTGEVHVSDVLDGTSPADVVVTDGFTGVVLVQALARADAQEGTPPTPKESVMLGVDGVVVVAPPQRAAAGVQTAAEAVRTGVTAALAAEMDLLLTRRRGA